MQHVCFDRPHIQDNAPPSDPRLAWTLRVNPALPSLLRAASRVWANRAAGTLRPKTPAARTHLMEDQAAFQNPQVPTHRLPLSNTPHKGAFIWFKNML